MNVAIRPSDRLTARPDNIRGRSDRQARAIVDDVTASVTSGSLRPGDRLPDERSLCSRYGAGRHTIRKALDALERQGLVGRFVGRGSFVLHPVPSAAPAPVAAPRTWPLFELTEARLLLEPGIAALAVERATSADLAQLGACLEAIAQAMTWRDFKEAKYAFHRVLAQITRNSFICDIFDQLIASRRQAWQGYHPRSQDLAATRAACMAESRAILDALAHGDAEEAAEAVRRSVTRILVSISEN